MFNEIEYHAPYFNNLDELRNAYQLLFPNEDYLGITALMVGALSVYVPEEKFRQLVADKMSQATAKMDNN